VRHKHTARLGQSLASKSFEDQVEHAEQLRRS
jgi:hypothetical protein